MNSVTAVAYMADPHTVTVIDEEEEQFWDMKKNNMKTSMRASMNKKK